MAEAIRHTPTIELAVHRCWECGRYWAHEVNREGICPVCAKGRVDGALDNQSRLERRLNAQKAATVRAKKRQAGRKGKG